ncbi:KH domain-containing protein [Candidatus Woesearchaeota archaeon]|nr:KH domain-containing protein [Candidatus Woesearchaeota archaeon]
MSGLKIKEKTIVVPGEILAAGMDYLPSFGTYREGDNIRAGRLGIAQVEGKVIKLIPVSGRYLPKRGDMIIGKIIDVSMSGWRVEINSPYSAMLMTKEATNEFIDKGANLTRIYNFDDYIVCGITNVSSQKLVDLTMRGPGLRKLRGGRIIEVNTHKVPRIIGKSGSMVGMIKHATGVNIIVGQNGLVWLNSEEPAMEVLAVETIRKIEAEAHIAGLTDRIKEFLEKKTGKKIELGSEQREERKDFERKEFENGNGESQ